MFHKVALLSSILKILVRQEKQMANIMILITKTIDKHLTHPTLLIKMSKLIISLLILKIRKIIRITILQIKITFTDLPR